MPKLPFMQFYPADWLQDTQVLSLEAQGAWMKILCALHVASERGRKTWVVRDIKQFLGYPEDDRALLLLNVLSEVADIEARDYDGNVCETLADAAEITITSRRMIRDEAKRIQELERKRAYEKRNPTRHRHKSDVVPTDARHDSDAYTSEVRSQISKEKNKEKKAPAQPNGFAEFWSAYPRKVGKGAAEKAWDKVKPPLPIVLTAIEKQKKQESWTKEGGQFIPHPATWLNQKRWEDEVVVLLPPVKAKVKGNEIDHGDSKSAIGWVAPPSFKIFEFQRGKVDNPIPIGKIIESLDMKSKKE